MTRFFIAFSFCVLFLACSDQKQNASATPEKLLSKPEMIQLMVDMQLVEAAKAKNYLSRADSMKEVKDAYAFVFEKHEITQKDFEENLLYYYNFTGQLEELYADVLNELVKEEAKLKKAKESKK